MPNDSKLGLLAGVAGVVAAAVLFYQNPPGEAPAPPGATAVSTAKPPDASGKPARPRFEAPAPTPVSVKSRQEPEGRAVSRTVGEEDE